MNESKRKNPEYAVDFVTALPVQDCLERLERSAVAPSQGWGGALAPFRQETVLGDNRTFTVERRFAGGLRPITFTGSLDPDDPHWFLQTRKDAPSRRTLRIRSCSKGWRCSSCFSC